MYDYATDAYTDKTGEIIILSEKYKTKDQNILNMHMMRHIITLLVLLCASSSAWSQSSGVQEKPWCNQFYIITDNDGYTNIREKPSTNSKILDKVVKYEVFFEYDYFCGREADGDIDLNTIPPNWAPISKDSETPIGYVFKGNVMHFRDMNYLSKYRDVGEPDTIMCSNGALTVSLILKPFDYEKHISKNGIFISGEYPKGLRVYEYTKEALVDEREIEALIINTPDKKYSLPVDAIKDYFNPHSMTVFVGPENELYISILCGNDGESFSLMLSVVNGKIIYVKDTSHC